MISSLGSILTVKMATQTVASMKPFDDLNSNSQGLLADSLVALSGSCAMVICAKS